MEIIPDLDGGGICSDDHCTDDPFWTDVREGKE